MILCVFLALDFVRELMYCGQFALFGKIEAGQIILVTKLRATYEKWCDKFSDIKVK